ncbi:MAG: sulfur oxidation c-type cytochrome SoxA [Alphaproteobacteria bacterium]|nr:sulfur oxidation c-type cytochrome SoxA [Alphaproteobacteria bacterium]
MNRRLGALLLLMATQASAEIPEAERRSGYHDMGASVQAMQDDDMANPAMLWVLDGEKLWAQRQGAAGRSCADCHGEPSRMTGVAVRYPAFSESASRPISLDQRINQCRTEQQKAPAFDYESRELLSLSALVAMQSREHKIAPPDDPRLRTFLEAGAATFNRRQGQLNLSCAQCHEDNRGKRLAGATIPQAHPTGYPIYRLEWQSLGSLQRRLRNCLIGMRAEPYAYGAPDYVALELYLMKRAAGMPFEAPGVRP